MKKLNQNAENSCCDVVPLPNVSASILAKVVEYCKYRVEAARNEVTADEVRAWEGNFVSVDQGTLFELILAANYLNLPELMNLACLTVSSVIRGKTPEEIRKAFNIKNDFSPEEEEEVLRENAWAFE